MTLHDDRRSPPGQRGPYAPTVPVAGIAIPAPRGETPGPHRHRKPRKARRRRFLPLLLVVAGVAWLNQSLVRTRLVAGQFTWRSGLGVDRGGNLVYVAADQLSLDGLAHTLAAAGAVRGMQLDIHPQTVGFLSYGPGQAASSGVGTPLLPSMHAGGGRYLQPSQRDFLAVSVPTVSSP